MSIERNLLKLLWEYLEGQFAGDLPTFMVRVVALKGWPWLLRLVTSARNYKQRKAAILEVSKYLVAGVEFVCTHGRPTIQNVEVFLREKGLL